MKPMRDFTPIVVPLAGLTFKCRIRLFVGIMLFMACFVSYTMKVSFNIIIIAMVQQQKNIANSTKAPPPNYGPRYDWSHKDQGLLISAWFTGFLLTIIPGGMLAESFGGSGVMGYTLLISSILMIITPLAAHINKYVIYIVRFLIGVFGGIHFPACQNLISKWAPPDEKGKFVVAILGGIFGTIVTWPVCGIIIEQFGWNWAFYLCGGFVLFISIIFLIIVSDTPAKHPFISEEELKYIEDSLGGDALSKPKKFPTLLKAFTSLPFMGLLILDFSSNWGFNFLITATPKFLIEVLGFEISKGGFLSSLPFMARLFMAFIFGSIVDVITRRKTLPITTLRKLFCVFSHILPGIFFLLIAYIRVDRAIIVTFLTFSLGFSGASVVTNLQNPQDLAPNYAGTLYGIMNFFGNFPGIISPMIVGYFSEENTIEEWKYIFIIGSFIYVIPSFVYFLIGSGDIQKWNDEGKVQDEGENKLKP